jgi:hypothetical protein
MAVKKSYSNYVEWLQEQSSSTYVRGHAVAKLIEALRYKLDGLWFDSRWYHWNFSLILHYDPGVDSASNRNEDQEYFIRGIVGGVKGPVRRADNLSTFMCRLSWNLGVSTSRKLQELSRSVQGLL